MKKITLVLAAMLLSITSATATKATVDLGQKDLRITNRYRYSQPILFVERGVEFLVFPSGEFDFNTEKNYSDRNRYNKKRNSRRGTINKTYGAPGVRINYTKPRGIYVSHDRFGRLRRVGNTFINYDTYGRVKRIGSVYMKYRHGKLKQVGGLNIKYNRRGDMVSLNGTVNYSNQGCGFCGMTGCTTDHFHNDYRDNDWYNYSDDLYSNEDYYYYKKGGKSLKKKNKRRRKY